MDLLVTDPYGIYIDGTVGGGGHSRIITGRLSDRGLLIGLDRDADAIARSREILPASVILVQGSFSSIDSLTRPHLREGAAGILLDLGVSSYQIDTAERGFSHRFSGPLDLRMDRSRGETAAELLARLSRDELTRILRDYGEDPQARRIANAILRERERSPIGSTDDLARVIDRAVPATRVKSLARTFQALRIAVNQELYELEHGLPAAWSILRPGGRLVIISYHSLEDRLVKNFFKEKSEPVRDPAGLPFSHTQVPTGRLLTRKPIVPEPTELLQNPRSRSAKLRAVEKLA